MYTKKMEDQSEKLKAVSMRKQGKGTNRLYDTDLLIFEG